MTNIQKILLIIGIVLFIIILDIFLCRITDKFVDNVIDELMSLKEVLKEDFEEGKNKSELLNKNWKDYEKKLSFFIEHDEIEKVSLKVVTIMENISNNKNEYALEDIIEMKYLLEHIKDKNKLKIENIF